MKYQLAGQKNPSRPLKRSLDCNIETETEHKAKVLERMLVVVMVAVTGQSL